ncbi:MAG: bifunctional diguanylate cyclase/phosphodiesterase [Paucibacter sp.]|nr:bifunctional diguanylate cyclase/phosphodiesterase [Roseateles sp.]
MLVVKRLRLLLDRRATAGQSPVLRMRRLMQLATVIGGAFLLSLIGFFGSLSGTLLLLICAGLVISALSMVIGRLHGPEAGGLLLLFGCATIMGSIIWVSNGLHDEGMLVFPVLLLMAELLISTLQFLLLTGAMLLYVLTLALATEYGWRTDAPLTSTWEAWQTITIALLAASAASWLVLNDLRNALARVESQMQATQASEQQARHLSAHDTLTGLLNRTHGRLQIEQIMAQARRDGCSVAVAFVDLDNFKLINDNLGHGAGDEFIKQTSARLKASVRASDIVARFGGDEFILGIAALASPEDAVRATSSVLEHLNGTIHALGHELTVTCSIGVAMFPIDGDDYETLVRKADTAMYDAKSAGRNAIRFFDASMNESAHESLWLINELRGAIARRELALHFQPIVDLATNEVVSAEALLRWQHGTRGSISPADFIPLAESSGLIVEIGEWVVNEACRSAAAWSQSGHADIGIAINLSPVQFRSGDIVDIIEKALAEHGLDAKRLELEITESLLVQSDERFQRAMSALKALGICIAVDDFGTGYSNLAYLQDFKVDVLKIDQSFVRRLGEDARNSSIVKAIIQMAHSLGLKTIAEGIETEGALAALRQLGCNRGQGFYLAKPGPLQAFAENVMKATQYAQGTERRSAFSNPTLCD